MNLTTFTPRFLTKKEFDINQKIEQKITNI